MKDGLETRWTEQDTLNSYNPFRELFREASAEVVRETFAKYVQPNSKILEIGSGLGELVRLVPDYKPQIQQTEQNPKIAEGNKVIDPESNVRVANVYELPFEDGSFNTVTGFSSFDTFADLGKALREVRRVLRPNGNLIHFLDLQGSANTIFHEFSTTKVIPFPLYEIDAKDNRISGRGVQLVDKRDINKLRGFFVSKHLGIAKWFDEYVKNPEFMFCTAYNNPGYRQVLRMASDWLKESGIDTQKVGFNEYFRKNVERNLVSEGYELIESGNNLGFVVVKRNSRHSHSPQTNLFHNKVGEDFSRYDSALARGLKPNEVKVVSELYTTVARKN